MVSMSAIVWNLQAIPMSAVSIWLYNNFSYSNVLTLGATLQFVGAWVRSYAIVN